MGFFKHVISYDCQEMCEAWWGGRVMGGRGGGGQVGLAILLRAGTVFRCYNHIHLTMFHSELGASKAILDAGFGLDCLMLRWALSFVISPWVFGICDLATIHLRGCV